MGPLRSSYWLPRFSRRCQDEPCARIISRVTKAGRGEDWPCSLATISILGFAKLVCELTVEGAHGYFGEVQEGLQVRTTLEGLDQFGNATPGLAADALENAQAWDDKGALPVLPLHLTCLGSVAAEAGWRMAAGVAGSRG